MTYEELDILEQRIRRILEASGPIENLDKLAKKLADDVEQFLDDYDIGTGWDPSDCL